MRQKVEKLGGRDGPGLKRSHAANKMLHLSSHKLVLVVLFLQVQVVIERQAVRDAARIEWTGK